MAKTLKPDPVLKGYWRNDSRFADLFNQVLFNGEERIQPEDLSDLDTDESNVLMEGDEMLAISRLRDLVKKFTPGIELAILGAENQMEIHHAMPVRNMLNDSLHYTKECKSIEQEHRKTNDLSGSADFLSGMTAHDRITPIITLIIYYGEEAWSGPDSLWDMMDIPDAFKPYIDNYHIHVFQVRNGDNYTFKNPDNKDFFTLISEFYNHSSRFKINEFREKYPDMTIYWETLAAVGAATGTTKLIKYALTHKGGRMNMCTALQGLIDEGRIDGRLEGHREGIEESIEKTVLILKELGIPKNIIYSKIVENFDLSKDDLPKYLS